MISGTETVTILARVAGDPDRYDQPSYSWPGPGVAVRDVLVAPGRSVEGNEAIRERVDTVCTLYLPPGVTVGARDKVIVRGETWDAAGEPARWGGSGGWDPGAVLELTRGEG